MLILLVALPASLLAGYMWDHISPGSPFYFGAALALVAAILLSILNIETKPVQKAV